jgi:hypothetical protein
VLKTKNNNSPSREPLRDNLQYCYFNIPTMKLKHFGNPDNNLRTGQYNLSGGRTLSVRGNDLSIGGIDLSVGGNDLSIAGHHLPAAGNEFPIEGKHLSAGGKEFSIAGKHLSTGGNDLTQPE